jgi:tRNA (cmo5U34)-methyltransferase
MSWDPDVYLREIRDEIAGFDVFQDEVAVATAGSEVDAALELGVGTGETTGRVRALHPTASWTGVDASAPMLERARSAFPDADLRLGRLEDALPEGPFDLVVSALVVHHLDSNGKRDLFRRVAGALREGGRFVLGDVVIPERAEDAQIEIDWIDDLPDRAADQIAWLEEAGFNAEVVWAERDLAVIRGTLR